MCGYTEGREKILKNLVEKKVTRITEGGSITFEMPFMDTVALCINKAYGDRDKLKITSLDDLLNKAMFGAVMMWNLKMGVNPQDAELQEETLLCMRLSKDLGINSLLKAGVIQDIGLYEQLKEEGRI